MTKFKVGDIVVGNQDNEANGVEQGQLYEVVATERECGYDYIKTDLSMGSWVLSERFDLYKAASQVEQDDPLPPAPESALYVNKWRWGVEVRNLGDEVRIGTGNPNSCKHGWTYATLDPDAALQLAHDLNRMANEIKRKEKQNA
ncbi:TPA: hypothetical protein LU182_004167 [Enterobacter hormaechei subsp. xiangfangensis]|nr:hypothetical protein [Enterobacter hormaechei subsp. xiangfangensis]HBM2586930.1 hypothetical protein [Enterobacter hormaechei subsp. xiangfangensis]HBM2871000.1 hypothetical protein [Enterobacter hormaechei subsp. xiangfangensis]HBM2875217.1 hypothetical protein [Enterobacter hormaechei subsp. xiangfangensis]